MLIMIGNFESCFNRSDESRVKTSIEGDAAPSSLSIKSREKSAFPTSGQNVVTVAVQGSVTIRANAAPRRQHAKAESGCAASPAKCGLRCNVPAPPSIAV
jgi:hypothetical protein